MASFEEYAALARHLHHQQRAEADGEQRVTRWRDAGEAAVARLDQRLTLQGQRLAQLAEAIGQPPPAAAPAAPAAGWPPGTPSGAPPDVTTGPLPPGNPGPAGALPPPGPGRPALSAVPSAPVSGAPAATGTPPSVPVPRAAEPVPAPADPPPVADPLQALELADRRADEADAVATRVQAMAQQPPLLPTWSPRARATGVYLACGLVAVLVQLVLVLTAGEGAGATFSLFAWMCAGLPTMAFFAGYLVLSVWGRPAVRTGPTDLHPVLGFGVCFALMPLGYCGWWVLSQVLTV